MLSVFTRCCPPAGARKHFIRFPGPRQHSHWDQSGSVTCFKSWSVLNSSQGHTGRFQQQKQSARLFVFCVQVLSRSTSITHRFRTFLQRMFFFLLRSPTGWWMIYCCCWLALFFRERALKIVTVITWYYFCHLKARGIQKQWYTPAHVLLLHFFFFNPVLSSSSFSIKVDRFRMFYCVFPVYFVCRVCLFRSNILPWSWNVKNRWKYFNSVSLFFLGSAVLIDGALLIGLNRMS